jgi:hypothetical protein
MRQKSHISPYLIVLLTIVGLLPLTVLGQTIVNYAHTRTTGNAYNSIASTGNAINAWRTTNISDGSYYDDNRSYPILIGFDFWYDGKRYTQFSASTNGFMDFDTSNWNGGSGAVQPTYPYGPYTQDFVSSTRSGGSNRGTVTALAPLYFDLTTWQTSVPLGNSIMYLLSGTAPNRVLTVEWINMSTWQVQSDTLNFQVKLYESSGAIEFNYGYMGGAVALESGFGFVTGINGPTLSNPPTAAQLLCLQTINTNTFSNTQRYTLIGMPGSYSKYTFTPNIPAAPTNLTFPGAFVTQISMTLNWTDNASNEVGYTIYNSTDGVNYTFVTQVAAASTSYAAGGLIPGTTYYWKVYAVTEGGLSTAVTGTQATTAAASFISTTTGGDWNVPGTWSPIGVPSANANVTIDNGATVTITTTPITVNNLTVGRGTSGILKIGSNATVITLNVLGNITVNSGGQFSANTASAATHQLNLSGNIVNSGTFDLASGATNLCSTTFNRAGNQTISGAGGMTRFSSMTVNMGNTSSNVLDITLSNFSTRSTGFLTLTNGTFKLESPASITPFIAPTTIGITTGLWINNASAVVNTTGGNLSVTGYLRVSNGTLTIGSLADQQLLANGGSFIFEGGTTNVAGSFVSSPYAIMNFSMSGGTLTAPTVGSTLAGNAPFTLTVAGSTFSQTGGTIIIRRAGNGNFGYINTNAASYTILGGLLQIGDNLTPAGQTMQVNTNNPVYNFTVSTANATAQIVTSNLQVNNDLTLAAGILNANNLNITLKGNWTNNGGTFTAGTGVVTFSGLSSQNIGGSSITSFSNVTLNNSAGLTSSNSILLTGILTLTNGALSIGANTLTFQTSNTPIVRTSGTITTTTSSNLVFGTAGNTGGTAFAIPASTFTSAPMMNNLTINRTNSLTFNNQMMSLSGILLCNGPLTTNGNLLLLSTATQTALIDGSSTGSITGNVTMQRYLPSGFGYKYISSPFQASTVNEFANDLNLAASFPTFYKYVENMASAGWVSYTTTSNSLNPLQGYAANFGSVAAAKTFDVTGAVNNGPLSVTLKNNNQPFTLGFNLVGNPYSSPINWNAASGWTKTNIDNALYYFQAGSTDQHTGTYSTYINGASSDGLATNIIPSMQGFFVHVSNGTYPVTGTLGVTNAVRTNDLTHAYLKSTTSDSLSLLRLTAGFADNGTPADPAVIYLDSSATLFFDKDLDALKLMNTDRVVPNVYAITPDSQRLSINAIPMLTDSVLRIQLGLRIVNDGWITLKINDIVRMPAGRFIYLVDAEAGLNLDVKVNPQYRFFLKAGEYENRFSLIFSVHALTTIPTEFKLLQNYPNPFNPRTTIQYVIPQKSSVTVTVYDMLGKEVAKLVDEEKVPGTYEVQFDGSTLSSGVYFYRMHAGAYMETKKIMLIK